MAGWPFLIVVDLNEVTVRCRTCPWRSDGHLTLQQASAAIAGHRCPGGGVG
jgi:hypothetical protein